MSYTTVREGEKLLNNFFNSINVASYLPSLKLDPATISTSLSDIANKPRQWLKAAGTVPANVFINRKGENDACG